MTSCEASRTSQKDTTLSKSRFAMVWLIYRRSTSNDPWGPAGSDMAEIAQMTFNSDDMLTDTRAETFYQIMDMIDKRLNDKGKNWRHVLKALKVLDYCLHEGSELVVTWARKNLYIIKTLREFQYIDEDGRDVGQNGRRCRNRLRGTLLILLVVRVSAKELTSLILDEDRLRTERADRKNWKSRVTGLDDFAEPSHAEPPRRHRPQRADEEDAEYRLALEASKFQEEEDRKKRESRHGEPDDDDLAKAIKLSQEEEELRRRELEEQNAHSLFDDDPIQVAQPTGFNQGYQQQGAVDWSGNPIDPSLQTQPTGYLNPYTTFQTSQPTGFQNGYQNGFAQQPTGSNNPFASTFNRPQTSHASSKPTLSILQEQKTLSQFNNSPSFNPPTTFTPPAPQKELSEHEARLNALLASGDGMDTFGNTGNLRIPAQHTAPGTFVNSAGAGLGRIHEQQTGHNPFLQSQFTGMPQTTYNNTASAGAFGSSPFGRQVPAATGPAGMNGGMNGFGQSSNPFGPRPQQGQNGQGGGDLIQF
ncbi:ENTH domain-containing protein [Rutstroemia sp. NJR-2017a BVV2]|nr:ENTH domain-containing protein [Rutstroemia sp. NJR-2017a BVV2]